MSFDALFFPRGVVIIGSCLFKLGNVLLKQVMDGKFEGGLYAVNPKAREPLESRIIGYINRQAS